MAISLPHGYVLQGKDMQYTIDRTLGQGSFGITYLAKYKTQIQGQLGSGSITAQVCIKEFFMCDMNSRDELTGSLHDSSDNSLVKRYRRAFLREARNLAKMHHPGIVNVFEVIETNNTAYIVMEYIDGGSLDEYIQAHGRLTEVEALRSFEPLCDAMCYMHAQQMLHLDLKPKNVMRDEEGHLYLIDFGLSKQYTADGEPESSTTIGHGTPGYAPIEQAKQKDGDHTFRATIDVYALGATLYKMLTGQTPPDATEVSEAALDGEDLIKQRLLAAGVSAKTSAICSKAMFPSAKKRYQTVAEVMFAFGWQVEAYTKENEPIMAVVVDERTLIDDPNLEPTQPTPQPNAQPFSVHPSQDRPSVSPSLTSAKSSFLDDSKRQLLKRLLSPTLTALFGLLLLIVVTNVYEEGLYYVVLYCSYLIIPLAIRFFRKGKSQAWLFLQLQAWILMIPNEYDWCEECDPLSILTHYTYHSKMYGIGVILSSFCVILSFVGHLRALRLPSPAPSAKVVWRNPLWFLLVLVTYALFALVIGKLSIDDEGFVGSIVYFLLVMVYLCQVLADLNRWILSLPLLLLLGLFLIEDWDGIFVFFFLLLTIFALQFVVRNLKSSLCLWRQQRNESGKKGWPWRKD